MSDLVTKFSGNDADLVKAYERIQRENVKLRDGMKDLANESKAAHDDAKAGADNYGKALADNVIPKVTDLIGGYLSMKTAIAAVNAEIEHQIDLQRKAAAAQLSAADPRAFMRQNLGNIPQAEFADVLKGVQGIALKGYGDVTTLERAMGELASATPSMSNSDRQKTLEIAARFAPQADQLPVVAAGLGDAEKVTGTSDALENLGVMSAVAAKSRATSTAAVAENTVPAAAGVRNVGGASASEALALVTAIQNASVDPEGRISGGASQALAQQLKTYFSDDAAAERREKVQKDVVGKLHRESNLPDFEQPDEQFRGQVSNFFANLTDAQKAQHGLTGKIPDRVEDQLELLKDESFRPLAGDFAEQQLASRHALSPDAARDRANREFGISDREGMSDYLLHGGSDRFGLEGELPGDSAGMAKLMVQTPGMKDDYLAERAKTMTAGEMPQDIDAQIHYLQEHPEAATDFWKTAHFEHKPTEPIHQLLTDKESKPALQYEELKTEIPSGEEARQLAQSVIEKQEEDPILSAQRMQRALANTATINKQNSLEKGRAGIARDQLLEVLDSTDIGGARKLVEKIGFEGKTGFGQIGAVEELIKAIERRQQELENPVEEETNFLRRFSGIGPHHGQFRDREQTAEEAQKAETLGLLLPVLREMLVQGKRSADLLEQQRQDNRNNAQANAAANRSRAARVEASEARGRE